MRYQIIEDVRVDPGFCAGGCKRYAVMDTLLDEKIASSGSALPMVTFCKQLNTLEDGPEMVW